MNNKPLVSIIIPTKNEEKNIEVCLKSIKGQAYRKIETIVVDNNSKDKTKEIAEKYTKLVFNKGPERSAQRNFGAKKSKGKYLIHIDCDMKMMPELVSESVRLLEKGFDALVIPERSFGSTFWARCKSLEKSFYEGNPNIESIRVIKKSKYIKLGGHDPELVFSEDKDLDLRARAAGLKIGRTQSLVLHNEGKATLLGMLRKKMLYSQTGEKFANKHPEAFRWQANIFNRYIIFLKNFRVIFSDPLVYIGLIFLKSLEFIAGATVYLRYSLKNE
jgi:arabinofuranan 3-O-arabinosyltransferase